MDNLQRQATSRLKDVPPLYVHSVRTILQSRLELPPELASIIISLAQYHARIVVHRHATIVYESKDYFDIEIGHTSVAGLYLISPPIPSPEEALRVKSVKFRMLASDQGRSSNGGDGTYHNSYTWFEATILQPTTTSSLDILNFEDSWPNGVRLTSATPSDALDVLREHGVQFRSTMDERVVWKVHNNITARSEPQEYCVEWVAGEKVDLTEEKEGMGIGMGDGEGFVQSLKHGDKIALWARATRQGTINRVGEASIVIDYEVW
ncbi:hypothetical protein PM082_014501 [Marasmius tenuissimus]|nr:hypothetical protein PM082_014501 [Marasmius tenuissimus]